MLKDLAFGTQWHLGRLMVGVTDQPGNLGYVIWCYSISHAIHWRFCCDLNVPRQQYKASIAEKEQEKAALKTSKKGAADSHQAFWMAALSSIIGCAERCCLEVFCWCFHNNLLFFHYYLWIVNALGLQDPTPAWWCGEGSRSPTFRLWKASALPRQRWLCKLCGENSIQHHCLLPVHLTMQSWWSCLN